MTTDPQPPVSAVIEDRRRAPEPRRDDVIRERINVLEDKRRAAYGTEADAQNITLELEDLRRELEELTAPADVEGSLLTGQRHAILELNGYNAVRTELLTHVNALAQIPLEAVDACLAFAREAARKADLSPHPQANQAREQMLAECAVYNATRKLLVELEETERRAQARERIVAR